MAMSPALLDAKGIYSPINLGLRGPELEPLPMSTKAAIAESIEAKVKSTNTHYYGWTVGITQDWMRRKEEHRNDGRDVGCWNWGQADSLSDAQDIERHFINKGMKGGTGGNMVPSKTTYVYIF